jgi:hypothetical protein
VEAVNNSPFDEPGRHPRETLFFSRSKVLPGISAVIIIRDLFYRIWNSRRVEGETYPSGLPLFPERKTPGKHMLVICKYG